MRRHIWTFVKLTFCGATIFGIGWLMLVGDQNAGVKDAEADVYDVAPIEVAVGGDFGEVLEKSGLEARPYEVNGNKVYFAVGQTDMAPGEVLEYYQDRFVKAGINKRKFLDVPEGHFKRSLGDIQKRDFSNYENDDHEWNAHLLNGGVVPVVYAPHYVSMGGLVPKKKRDLLEQTYTDWSNSGDGLFDLDSNAKGYRFLDGHRYPGSDSTRLTAVWADEGFDFSKMQDPNQAGVPASENVPSCVGCSLGSQLASLMPNEPYQMRRFVSGNGVDSVKNFYQRAMRNRGYRETDAAAALNYARNLFPTEIPEGTVLDFRKDGSRVSVAVMPFADGTSVVAMESEGSAAAVQETPYGTDSPK